MITVNGKGFPWEEGLTVKRLLEKKGYTYPAIVVTINGTPIAEEQYAVTLINDGDEVKAIHMIAGG